MLFGKKDKESRNYEDPATSYGRLLRRKKKKRNESQPKRSFWEKIFGMGHDSDFVYYDD